MNPHKASGREGRMIFFLFYRWENTMFNHWQSKDKSLEQLPSSPTSPLDIMPRWIWGHTASRVFLLLSRPLQETFAASPLHSPGKSSSSLSPLTPHSETAQGNASSCLRTHPTLWHPWASPGAQMTSSTARLLPCGWEHSQPGLGRL